MSDGFDLSGGGGRYFSFGQRGAQPGAHIAGLVVDMKEVQATNFKTKEPEFWDNGDPKMQYKVTLQTELRDPAEPTDDGKRDIYLDGRRKPNDDGTKSKLCAVLDAVRAVTGGTQLQRNGKLTVQWVSGMGETGDPRCYAAWYEAPALNLQQPGQPPVAAPAQQAPPAPVQQPAQPPQWAQQAQPAASPGAVTQTVQTEQGPVNPATGEIAGPPHAQQPALVGAGAPAARQFVNAQGQPATPEAIAGLRAAGIDPGAVYAGYDGSLG